MNLGVSSPESSGEGRRRVHSVRPLVNIKRYQAMLAIAQINLVAGWIGMLLGALSGALLGLFFHRKDWAGGYTSFRRRMMRLGHIAFFGLGFLNILLELTMEARPLPSIYTGVASYSLIIGALTMPICCFLTAWRREFRHSFPIPVLAISTSIILVVVAFFYEAGS